MTLLSSSAMLAPFQVRSFRFQWPADLLTSCGIEMENLVFGWYILAHSMKINSLGRGSPGYIPAYMPPTV